MSSEQEEKTKPRNNNLIEDLIRDLAQHRVLVVQLKGQVESLSSIKETVHEMLSNFERLADNIEEVMLKQAELEQRIENIEKQCAVCPESQRGT